MKKPYSTMKREDPGPQLLHNTTGSDGPGPSFQSRETLHPPSEWQLCSVLGTL